MRSIVNGKNLVAPDELLRLVESAVLSGCTQLDLAGKGLKELPPEIGKLGRLKVLSLGRSDRKYGNLTNDLSTLPSEIGCLTSLESLHVRFNKLSKLPESIGQLKNLRTLHLSSNKLSKLPESLGQLKNLRTLHLSSNKLSKLPESLGQLKNLRELYLGFNKILVLPEGIGQLTNLRSLYLSSNKMLVLPESIGQLYNLQSLDLISNALSNIPRTIVQLHNLEDLDLTSNQLTMLPEGIGQLTKLKNLNLGSNQLSAIPKSIGQLINLRVLDLSFNQISDLPESIIQLSMLEVLDLKSNYLSNLGLSESATRLSKLKDLNVSSNRLFILPDSIERLTGLKTLNLSLNQLSSIPKRARNLRNLEQLDLRGNPLPIPPEILGPKEEYKEPNPASETLDLYFSLQVERGSIPLYEAKVILVGEGGVGKTSLAKKIKNEEYQLLRTEESTEGIEVTRWDFPLPDDTKTIFRSNIWDFGGQEIYHATHQFFLTRRSLYLLVVDTRKDNTNFYYWLRIIELLSDNSPVLIVENEKQNRKCKIDKGLFQRKFSNLKDSFSTNLLDNRGLSDVKKAIRYQIARLPHVGQSLPKIWVRVRAALENCAQSCNTISIENYFNICRQNGFTDRQQMLFLSSYLHDLGVCLHFQGDKLLKHIVILRPEWATAAVYKVVESEVVRSNGGRFTHEELSKIWSDCQYAELVDQLLQLMIRFKLAYSIPSLSSNYIAPQLLPVNKPNYPWDNTDNLVIYYKYEFMPKGLISLFIVEAHRLIEDHSYVWKNGVILADHSWARAEIIENYPESQISVRVSGVNRKPLLEKVRYELWKIHESYERLRYEELIPCNCSYCKNSGNLEFYSYDLLRRYMSDRRYEIECRTSYEKVEVRCLISDITDSEAVQHSEPLFGDFSNELIAFRQNRSILSNMNIHNDIRIDGRLSNQNIQSDYNDMSSEVNQYGWGDNIFGDKVLGDKIQTQINNNPDLAQSAQDIKALLDELSEEYNPNTSRGQVKIEEAALAQIEQNSTLRQRSLSALKSAGEEALAQAIQHPVAKVVVKGIKGFIEG